MEFTLVYQGPLKANGNPTVKQKLRRAFHKQLKQLWKQPPLVRCGPPEGYFLDDNPPDGSLSIIEKVNSFRFAPLITSKLHLIAELDMTLLRPEQPGLIVTQGGDIDNRLKTLLDALRMPKHSNELPRKDSPQAGEDPFFCLLEDDNLITKLAIETDRLLEPNREPSSVNLMIHVKTKATSLTYANIELA